MGSRPDGWWRDRAGAAIRLHDDLAKLDGQFVLVVEGAAKTARFVSVTSVQVVLAEGSGDDTIAALAEPGTLVVTADRELRGRCEQRGAEVVGPAWLLRQFEH
jgi:8-oxo-dGTP diphosphatase